MKHIRYFETTSAFANAYSNEYVEPWVSYTEENQEINYNKLIKTPLTFTILDNYTYLSWYITQNVDIPFRIYVSVNGGDEFYVDTSSTYPGTSLGGPFSAGTEITIRGENETYANPSDIYTHARFISGGRVSVKGNIMSLIYRNNFEDKTYFPQGSNFNFCGLFEGLYNLVDASKLILPATTLTVGCYFNMFNGCTSLTTAPELPATTLADNCYNGMFYYCSLLASAPSLPATTLTSHCYATMFGNCSSLTTAPELPATTLTDNCYAFMFGYCSSLTTAPELPATTLVPYCYNSMFQGCSKLNYIKCLATNISADSCRTNWVSGVASTGTFIKNPSMTGWTTGNNGIPSGWTTQNAS